MCWFYLLLKQVNYGKMFRIHVLVCALIIMGHLPSYIGTTCETPSPESHTIPVVRPEAYSDNTAWMAT